MVAETLALALRDNQKIVGIPVREIINLLNQFADDMDMFLLAEEECLNEVFNELENFHHHTGFTINYDKTKILRIGALKDTDAKLITQKQVAWTNEPINVLGVMVGHGDLLELNYRKLIDKAKATLNTWRQRSLSLIGKILIINTLIASLFVYKMTVLPSIPEYMVKELETEFRKFIWNGKKAKISLKTLQAGKSSGGLGLVDLRIRDKALKISWIQILEQDETIANLAYEAIEPQMKQWIFDCNLSPKDVKVLNIKNQFWHDMLQAWCTYNFVENKMGDQCIWYNSQIRIKNVPFFWSKIYEKGLFKVSQLFHQGKLITFKEAERQYGLTYIELYAIFTALPKHLRQIEPSEWQSNYAQLLDVKNITQKVYHTCTRMEDIVNKTKNKWEQELNFSWSNKDFNTEIRNIYRVTNIPKFRSFQYRIMHRALVLNTHLQKWGLRENNLCTFCEKYTETYTHLFYYCEKVQELWWQISNFVGQFATVDLNISPKTVMFNKITEKSTHVLNFICLLFKQYIYRKRCENKELKAREIKLQILSMQNLELYIAKSNNNVSKHNRKWVAAHAQNMGNL